MSCSFFCLTSQNLLSQTTSGSSKAFVKWTTWTLIQTIPSPVFFQDKNDADSRLQFGLRWNIVPLNYSFGSNKLVSPAQFFFVNPVRRNAGSVELFVQPGWATASYEFSEFERFNLASGLRVYIPAVEYGEYLSLSAGGKYTVQKNISGNSNNYASVEAGIYSFFGIIGLQFDYNFISQSRYSIGINLKYY